MTLDTDAWSLVVGIASLVVAVLAWVLPATRNRLRALGRRLLRLIGTDLRTYRAWFADEFGVLQNVYLDREEKLSLADTYVPLAGYRGSGTDRINAADVLRDPANQRLIILGDPGSGKSTLLKAFGTSLVHGARRSPGTTSRTSASTRRCWSHCARSPAIWKRPGPDRCAPSCTTSSSTGMPESGSPRTCSTRCWEAGRRCCCWTGWTRFRRPPAATSGPRCWSSSGTTRPCASC